MATRNSKSSSNSPKSHSGLKTAAALAVIGAATVAVAKGLKTRRGQALKKKALTKGRQALREAKVAAGRSLVRSAKKSRAR